MLEDKIIDLLSKKTKWYSELENSLRLIAKAEQLARSSRHGMIYEEKDELPKEIENKSPEELANELWNFMLNEYPNAGQRERYSIERTFWMEKGVERYGTKARLLIDKVSNIISRKTNESEKEKIPDTVEKCINWLKENQMKKLTKTDLNGFLAENSLDLSTTNRSIIHSRVNLKLKKLE